MANSGVTSSQSYLSSIMDDSTITRRLRCTGSVSGIRTYLQAISTDSKAGSVKPPEHEPSQAARVKDDALLPSARVIELKTLQFGELGQL